MRMVDVNMLEKMRKMPVEGHMELEEEGEDMMRS
jgi:hypothetical protein